MNPSSDKVIHEGVGTFKPSLNNTNSLNQQECNWKRKETREQQKAKQSTT